MPSKTKNIAKKSTNKPAKDQSNKGVSETIPPPLLEKPVKINKPRDAKRLLSRLIYNFQLGLIKDKDAKTLTYLLISYIQINSQVDLEERIAELEKKLGNQLSEMG